MIPPQTVGNCKCVLLFERWTSCSLVWWMIFYYNIKHSLYYERKFYFHWVRKFWILFVVLFEFAINFSGFINKLAINFWGLLSYSYLNRHSFWRDTLLPIWPSFLPKLLEAWKVSVGKPNGLAIFMGGKCMLVCMKRSLRLDAWSQLILLCNWTV